MIIIWAGQKKQMALKDNPKLMLKHPRGNTDTVIKIKPERKYCLIWS